MIKLTSFSRYELFIEFLCLNFSKYTFSWFPIPDPYLEFNFYFEDKTLALGVLVDGGDHIFVSKTREGLDGMDLFEEVLKKKEVKYAKI